MTKIFTLDFLFDRPSNNPYEAYPLPFAEENYFRAAADTKFDKVEFLPKGPVYMKVKFQDIHKCQLLKNPFNWFLISDLMYKTLLSIEPIEHFMWPAVLIDMNHRGKYFEESGPLKSKVKFDNSFKFFGLHTRFECFDREYSQWTPNPFAPPDKISGITKLVLKSHDGYFPPIFTLPEKSNLFITGQIKDLLVQNDVRGVEFQEIEVSG